MNKLEDGTYNAIGSFCYSCLSLFFMVAITRINGLEDAGAFSLMFALCNLLYGVGIYSGRVYQVSDRSKGVGDVDYLTQRVITTGLMFIVGVIVICFEGKYKANLLLGALILIFRCLDSISEVFYGIMQKHGKLGMVGKSMIVKSIGIIMLFLVADIIVRNVCVAFVSVIGITIAEMVICEYPEVSGYLKRNTNWESVKKIFRKGIYACLIMLLSNYMVSAPKYALADVVSAKEQAVFNIISMPASIVVLCAGFVVQPFVVDMTEYYKTKQYGSLRGCFMICSGIVIFAALLCLLAGYYYGVPVLSVVYGTDISSYLTEMTVILVGAVFAGEFNVLIAVLTIMSRTKMVMVITGIISAITYCMSFVMTQRYGLAGGAMTYALTIGFAAMCSLLAYQTVLVSEENKKIL